MSARARILAALRDAHVTQPAADVPREPAAADPADPARALADFRAGVEAASGVLHVLEAGTSVAEYNRGLHASASTVCAAEGLWPVAVDAPTDLATLDVAVAHGHFGVTENGAVWVDGVAGVPRAALWLCRHLVLVVPRDSLLPDMHAAYARLGQARMPDFGAFISGPSKTADIEQCLVIGAHGPLSLDVVLTI